MSVRPPGVCEEHEQRRCRGAAGIHHDRTIGAVTCGAIAAELDGASPEVERRLGRGIGGTDGRDPVFELAGSSDDPQGSVSLRALAEMKDLFA